MQSLKIITIGSATLDLFFQSEDLPQSKDGLRLSLAYGGKYVAKKFAQSIGGGGCNAAVSLARQGFDTFFWGKIGTDWAGNQVRKKLDAEKVGISLIQKSKQTNVSAILVGQKGERTIITFRSQNDKLDFNETVKASFREVDWIYQANLNFCPAEKRASWLEFARQNHLKTCVTLSGDEFKLGENYVKKFIDLSNIFVVNAHELADIWGGNASDLDLDRINYAKKLNARILVVTYDIHGSWAYLQERIYYQPIVKAKVVDATGAGDAYASGFLGNFLKTKKIQSAMAFGAKNAASVISFLTCQKGLLAS